MMILKHFRQGMLMLSLQLCCVCSISLTASGQKKKLTGTGDFIYGRPGKKGEVLKDTLYNRQVTNITGFRGPNFQPFFLVNTGGEGKDSIKRIPLLSLFQAKIKSPDKQDSLVYMFYGSYLWQVLKEKNNLRVLYRSYDKDDTIYDGTNNQSQTNRYSLESIIVLRNDRKIWNIPETNYSKKSLLKIINSRYHQSFREKDFSGPDQLLDYLLEAENKGI
ncbi:hypothetical protein ECE50_004520 [Chitinophaga sp. Mgbs1]|uniref:Uncharacterized protein n=1 Tax=Chitinophaga solisilvae TaxID=1233460 RepID=A0A9Q5CW98_9BACT|nr:hypothetical protein [Chitinophaga solisilvae]